MRVVIAEVDGLVLIPICAGGDKVRSMAKLTKREDR
jgi:hypothetical protein